MSTEDAGGWDLSNFKPVGEAPPAAATPAPVNGWDLSAFKPVGSPAASASPAVSADAARPSVAEQIANRPGPIPPPTAMEYNQFANDPTQMHRDVEGPFDTLPAVTQAARGVQRVVQATGLDKAQFQLPSGSAAASTKQPAGPPADTDEAAAGLSDMIEGTARAAGPLAVLTGLAAPLETAGTLAAGYGASKAGETGAKALGASPEVSRAAGNLAGAAVVGGLGKGLLEKVYEGLGSPEVKIGGKFPEPKPFADMTDEELVNQANAIRNNPPKNYDWQVQEIMRSEERRVGKECRSRW